jgi:molecular chaperone GrpE
MSEEQSTRDLNPDLDINLTGGADGAELDSADHPSDDGVDQSEISAKELQTLKSKAAKADENWDKFVRATADFDNYKKRAAREKIEATKYANEALIERLIPILDNFEAAMTAATSAQTQSNDSLKTGVSMILSQFKNVLTDSGLEEIDAIGKQFDPNLHEAVSQESSAEVAEGQVLKQLRKGYKLRDKLIRPAMVVVAKKA